MAEFDDKQRRIFQYHNGTAEVWGDPGYLWRELTIALKGEVALVVKDINAALPPPTWPEGKPFEPPAGSDMVAALASKKFEEAIRQAFGMTTFDATEGSGADVQRCLDAYDALIRFQDKKKESGETPPSSRPPSPARYNQ